MVGRILQTWFGVSKSVDRVTYAASGLWLTVVKYGVEAALFWVFANTYLTPWQFINPLLSAREVILRPAPPWLGWVIYLWTLPFLWIAVSMSIRRAADAGTSPWMGFFVLVPVVNLCFMALLCICPSRQGRGWELARQREAGPEQPTQAALAVGLAVVVGAAMAGTSIYLLSSYGSSLFLGTPLMMGATSAYVYNRGTSRSYGVSLGLGMASVLLGCVGLLLFALEGIICLVMALPITVPVAALGAALGKAIADASRQSVRGMAAALLMLPGWAAGEAWLASAPLREVLTVVEIDAPPAQVWKHVVEFPDLPKQRAWYFRLGIACPERARIVGSGVGAIRYCQFTTGDFVEPITVWEQPNRLAFDVSEQPAPMFELSPYEKVHPPHLDGFLTSTRGEFRLVERQGGGTRLEGRTWYRCHMFPQWYWAAWSDELIHRIHERVLLHIRQLAESNAVDDEM